jgi:hypothetical protein
MSKLELTDQEIALLRNTVIIGHKTRQSIAKKVLAFLETQEKSEQPTPVAGVTVVGKCDICGDWQTHCGHAAKPNPRRMQGNHAQNPDILLRAAHLREHEENHACGLLGCIPVTEARGK